ncbi:MAG: peptide chain release factor 1 [Candidatus Omnitrophica bacterium]|nr:peptide chain release factor 1 [Candidatus Omnitrophota bacterium]
MSQPSPVRRKANSLAERYRELEARLADPEVTGNPNAYQKCAKELSSLKGIMEAVRQLENLESELANLAEVSKDSSAEEELRTMARGELEDVQERCDVLEAKLEEMILGEEEGINRNCIVEIRAGTGGEEAALFANDLYRMYSKLAAARHWKVEPISFSPSEVGGAKEVVFSLIGEGAFGALRFESGVHRVQRVPATEASGRIHTSAATVAVLPEAEELDVEIKPHDLRVDVYRSSGPGGQGVNTTDSAVRLTHLPTGLVVTCQDERSQIKNKAKAMRVMRSRLLDRMQREQEKDISQQRRKFVGSGDRSEKIRTYNYPERRVTDHRIGLTVHRLEEVLEGDLDEFLAGLQERYREARLAEEAQKQS